MVYGLHYRCFYTQVQIVALNITEHNLYNKFVKTKTKLSMVRYVMMTKTAHLTYCLQLELKTTMDNSHFLSDNKIFY